MKEYVCEECKVYSGIQKYLVLDTYICCLNGMDIWFDSLKVVDKLKYKDDYDKNRFKIFVSSKNVYIDKNSIVSNINGKIYM